MHLVTLLVLFSLGSFVSGWSPIRISDGDYYSAEPSIAVLGDTVAIVYESYSFGNDEIMLKYSYDHGLTFSPAVRISYNDSSSWHPKISIANGFNIVWEDNRTGKRQIFTGRFDGASVGTSMRISTGTGASAFPSTAADGSNIFFTWEDNRDGNDEIYFRKYDNGTWSPEKRLTVGDSTSWGADIDYDASTNTLHLVYFDHTTGNDEVYYMNSGDRGETWSSPVNISNDVADSWEPRIAAFAGRVAIVWYTYNANTLSYEVMYTEKVNPGSFLSPYIISPLNYDSKCPSVSLSSSNTAVVWEDFRDGNDEIYVSYKEHSDTLWQEERVTEDPSESYGAKVACGRDKLFVAWFDYRDKVDQVYMSNKTMTSIKTRPLHSSYITTPSLIVFPNPVNETAKVTANGFRGEVEIKIIDITGKVIKRYSLVGESMMKSIDLNLDKLANGVYNLLVTDKISRMSKKILLFK